MNHNDQLIIPPPASPEEWEATMNYADTHAGEIDGAGLPDAAETKRVCDALAAMVAKDAMEKLEHQPKPETLADFIKQDVINANLACAATLLAEKGTGELPVELQVCGGSGCVHPGEWPCRATDNGYQCTLARGHTGPHAACAFGEHNMHTWRAS